MKQRIRFLTVRAVIAFTAGFATGLAGLSSWAWTYAPNYWLFGLAFLGFSIMAGLLWLRVFRPPDPYGTSVQVYNCARCTQDHQLYFKQFIYHPVTDINSVPYTHWAMCPVLNEPVLMRIIDEDAKFAGNY